jgi:hypothetical protein
MGVGQLLLFYNGKIEVLAGRGDRRWRWGLAGDLDRNEVPMPKRKKHSISNALSVYGRFWGLGTNF